MPDAGRAAGDDAHLALDAAGERAVDEQVRVEVALPVVPDLRRIGVERRHADAGALQRLRRLAIVVARRPVDELEHVAGMPRSVSTTFIARFTGARPARP